MNKIETSSLMNNLVKKKKKSLLFYSLICSCFLLISITLLLFSKRPYFIYLVISIIITIIFGFYSVYYFTITFKQINEELSLINKIDNSVINKEYAYFDDIIDTKYYKNFTIYVYSFKLLDNEIKKYYSFLKIEKIDKKYYIESKLNYIVSFKVNANE